MIALSIALQIATMPAQVYAAPAAAPEYIRVSPFAGVSLEIPKDWVLSDRTAGVKSASSAAERAYGKPDAQALLEGMTGVMQIHPAGSSSAAGIQFVMTKQIMTQDALKKLDDQQTKECVRGYTESVRKGFEAQGFTIISSDVSRTVHDSLAALTSQWTITTANDEAYTVEGLDIPTDTNQLSISFISQKKSEEYGDILAHARETITVQIDGVTRKP